MSHVVKMECDMKSKPALKRAVKQLGLQWNEGVTKFNYYSDRVASCDHTISMKGGGKAIGVKHAKKGLELMWDPGYLNREMLNAVGGREATNLKREYAVAAATIEAENEGMAVTRYDVGGKIRLECTPSA